MYVRDRQNAFVHRLLAGKRLASEIKHAIILLGENMDEMQVY
jgi:hypothetical protein